MFNWLCYEAVKMQDRDVLRVTVRGGDGSGVADVT